MDNSSTVHFPCIHSKHGGEINKLTCFVNHKIKGVVKSIGLQESVIEKLITASRNHENTKEAAFSIFVRVQNPNFQGRSYELAFALADKLSRYQLYDENIKYFATGVIESDGVGKVTKIDGINEKLALIGADISNGDVLFFPKQNIDQSDLEQAALLTKITEKGAQYFPIENTRDIVTLINPNIVFKKAKNTSYLKYWILPVLVILIGYFLFIKSSVETGEMLKEVPEKIPEKSVVKGKEDVDSSQGIMEPVEMPMDHF